jgi:hypothetical protein
MIAVVMKYPLRPDAEKDELFDRFVAETAGVVHAYQVEGPDGGATITIWESQEARDAYMQSSLKGEVDSALPGLTRDVYTVRRAK